MEFWTKSSRLFRHFDYFLPYEPNARQLSYAIFESANYYQTALKLADTVVFRAFQGQCHSYFQGYRLVSCAQTGQSFRRENWWIC